MELREFIELRGMYHERNLDYDCDGNSENQSFYKDEFKLVGQAFLKRAAREMKLDQVDIHYNPAGIACSGDHTLIGMRGDKGIYVSFNTDGLSGILYRKVQHMKDWSGGVNKYISFDTPETTTIAIMDAILL